jgi:hypothetical protein
MPFIIVKNRKSKKGKYTYSVINKYTRRNFSPKGIPLSRAKKQLAALYINFSKNNKETVPTLARKTRKQKIRNDNRK